MERTYRNNVGKNLCQKSKKRNQIKQFLFCEWAQWTHDWYYSSQGKRASESHTDGKGKIKEIDKKTRLWIMAVFNLVLWLTENTAYTPKCSASNTLCVAGWLAQRWNTSSIIPTVLMGIEQKKKNGVHDKTKDNGFCMRMHSTKIEWNKNTI